MKYRKKQKIRKIEKKKSLNLPCSSWFANLFLQTLVELVCDEVAVLALSLAFVLLSFQTPLRLYLL